MALAQIRLPPRVIKFGKICGIILVVYCLYLSADKHLVRLTFWKRWISPRVGDPSSRASKRKNVTSLRVPTISLQGITRTPKILPPSVEPTTLRYLAPFNTLKDLRSRNNQSVTPQKYYGEMFRSGLGLTPFKTEDGQNGWVENGVVLRPIRANLNLMSNHRGLESPHPSDFEFYAPFDEKVFFQGTKRSLGESANPKLILYYKALRYFGGNPKPGPLRLCPEFPCHITTNIKYQRSSSAIVFEGSLINHEVPKRNPEQVFIFHHTETPLSAGYVNNSWLTQGQWRGAFNWTMSFRMDSDIPTPYGLVRKRPEPLQTNFTKLMAKKTKMAATMMSHCHTNSKRELYIKKLQEYVPVDIFGKCGTKCLRGSDARCAEILASKYKFYLAVENALCDDYVTEKFFRFLSYDFIVVARGGTGYFKHAPPEIFINTADFKTPKDLAKRLVYLDQHPDEYEAMLREKNKYVSMFEAYYRVNEGRTLYVHYHYEAVPFCRICHRLWTLESHRKTIPDIKAWILNTTCIEPSDF